MLGDTFQRLKKKKMQTGVWIITGAGGVLRIRVCSLNQSQCLKFNFITITEGKCFTGQDVRVRNT